MDDNIDADRNLASFARDCHPACIACRSRAQGGLGLRFNTCEDGSVEADFTCDPEYQSYPDRLHGGVIALLLDAAMTHCMFARELHGVTARMSIRFHQPAAIGARATIRARFVRTTHYLFSLEAEMIQDDLVRASAEAMFLYHPQEMEQAERPLPS